MSAGLKKTMDLVTGEVIDLTPMIEVVTSTDTPLLSMLMAKNTTKATSQVVTWREDALDETDNGGMLEGAKAPDSVKAVRALKTNNCQILAKTAEVSGTINALNIFGIGSEMNRQLQLRMAEVRNLLEKYIIQGTKADESGTTARQMNGFINLVAAANVITSAGKLTVAEINQGFEKMYEKGANNGQLVIFCNAKVKRFLSDVYRDGAQAEYEKGGSKNLGISVDTVTSDLGDQAIIVVDRHMPDGTILGLNMDFAELTELRKLHAVVLAKTGDSTAAEVIWEASVKLRNEYGGFKITGITSGK